jgi:membrane protein implicated in regulation of membrane protease activity
MASIDYAPRSRRVAPSGNDVGVAVFILMVVIAGLLAAYAVLAMFMMWFGRHEVDTATFVREFALALVVFVVAAALTTVALRIAIRRIRQNKLRNHHEESP